MRCVHTRASFWSQKRLSAQWWAVWKMDRRWKRCSMRFLYHWRARTAACRTRCRHRAGHALHSPGSWTGISVGNSGRQRTSAICWWRTRSMRRSGHRQEWTAANAWTGDDIREKAAGLPGRKSAHPDRAPCLQRHRWSMLTIGDWILRMTVRGWRRIRPVT